MHGMEILAEEWMVLMASYDYLCPFGNEMITIERGMTEEEVIPRCGNCNTEMKRVYHAPPVKFNGTGFYSTGG
jgi:predicted nucleic acid-binding Zn ribbon protein